MDQDPNLMQKKDTSSHRLWKLRLNRLPLRQLWYWRVRLEAHLSRQGELGNGQYLLNVLLILPLLSKTRTSAPFQHTCALTPPTRPLVAIERLLYPRSLYPKNTGLKNSIKNCFFRHIRLTEGVPVNVGRYLSTPPGSDGRLQSQTLSGSIRSNIHILILFIFYNIL